MSQDIKQEITPNVFNDLRSLTENAAVPKIFTNGFQCGFSLSDAHLILKHNEAPAAIITMGLPAAKSLINQLQLLIEVYERNIGLQVLSIEEIANKINVSK